MDPYRLLKVSPGAPEAELRAAYRRAVQRHHPDHNNGSPEAARRFEEVQEAWAQIRRARPGTRRPTATATATASDPGLEARLAAMERELQEARAQAAREAAAATRPPEATARPSDDELGYIKTDDSVGAILSDAREELLGELRDKAPAERAADLLEEVAAALRGERPKRST